MKRNKRRNRYISLLMSLFILISSFAALEPAEASAASKYITVEAFIKYLVTEMKFTVNKTAQPYIDAAMNYGILKEGDFKDYKKYLTRTDCAVIANRLDENINFKYNYSPEVYELLSNCNYYEGKFYYNTKGHLYPSGATKETYPASQFLEEILNPILETTFKYDDWADKGLRAGYEYTYDSDGNILNRYIKFGVTPEDEFNIVGIDLFSESSYIVKAWNKIKDGDRKAATVLEKRISDINNVPKNKRQAVADIMAKGIIKGYSNGLYVKNRSFKGSSKITVAGAKDVIQKVIHPEQRALISPDGQLIRTTNLPKNAADYPYILECFPNDFYEMRYEFTFFNGWKDGTVDKSRYTYPAETTYQYLYKNYYEGSMNFEMDKYEYYDTAISRAEEYLKYAFNMDYRTVGKEWANKINLTFAQHFDKRIYNNILDYIDAAKKNHVIVESDLISIEPSTIYYKYDSLFIRAYVRYRITADNINVDPDELIYGNNNFQNLKNGEWRYGYYDIEIYSSGLGEKRNLRNWGVSTLVGISDWAYRGSYLQ